MDKPQIQYAVEEAVVAGFTKMVFIAEHLYVAKTSTGASNFHAWHRRSYVLNNRIFDHLERVEHSFSTWNN